MAPSTTQPASPRRWAFTIMRSPMMELVRSPPASSQSLHQLVPGHDAARRGRERPQQVELGGGQLHRLTLDPHFSGGGVDGYACGAHASYTTGAVASARAAPMRPGGRTGRGAETT